MATTPVLPGAAPANADAHVSWQKLIWGEALTEYEVKRAASDAMPSGAEDEDEAVDAYCAAMDNLILNTAAPDIKAVVTKLKLAMSREPAGFGEYGEAIIDDLQQLNELAALAWIDRWAALGGSFGRGRNADGSDRGIYRGMPMPYVWEPPTCQDALAKSPHLRPHEVILESDQHEGACKMLESLLTLLPGLRDAVRDVGGFLTADRGYAGPDHIADFLKAHLYLATTDQHTEEG